MTGRNLTMKIMMLPLLLTTTLSSSWGFLLREVRRSVDVTRPVVMTSVNILAKNDGSSSVGKFYLSFPAWQDNLIGFINAAIDNVDISSIRSVQPTESLPFSFPSSSVEVSSSSSSTSASIKFYEIGFPSLIAPGDSLNITITYYMGKCQIPLPGAIDQKHEQYVVYEDLRYFFTPYKTKSQTMTIRFPSGKSVMAFIPNDGTQDFAKNSIEWSSEISPSLPPFSQANDDIAGPFVSAHYLQNSALPVLKSVIRDIEISHFGNVFFHESFDMKNQAARLTGEFSRIPYMLRTPVKSREITVINTRIPYPVRDLFYYDHIGNISSSHVSLMKSGNWVRLELQPRYPILGGWEADWQLQYNIPTTSILFVNASDPSRHLLEIPFSHPVTQMFTEKFEIRIALPYGATDIHFDLPREVESIEETVKWSWLDIFKGRPARVIKLRNYYGITTSRDRLKLYYTFTGQSQFEKPLILIMFCFIPFILVILSQRFTFTTLTEKETSAKAQAELCTEAARQSLDLYEDLCSANQTFIAKSSQSSTFESAKPIWSKRSECIVAKFNETWRNLPRRENVIETLKNLQSLVLILAQSNTEDGGKSGRREDSATTRKVQELESQLLRFFNEAKSCVITTT